MLLKTKKYENENLEYYVPKGDKYNVNTYKNSEWFVEKIVNGEMSIRKQKKNKTNYGI